MNLYEMCKELETFEFDIDLETGEVLNADELDALEVSRDEKILNCIYFLKNKQAEAEALKAEKQRFADRQKAAENQVARMKDYMAVCLNGDKWQSADKTHKITYRRSEEVRADVSQISDEFLRYKEPELDKAKIKKALKAGEVIPGAELVEKLNMQVQ